MHLKSQSFRRIRFASLATLKSSDDAEREKTRDVVFQLTKSSLPSTLTPILRQTAIRATDKALKLKRGDKDSFLRDNAVEAFEKFASRTQCFWFVL